MPKYELSYFDTSGRAAVARLLFRLAKVDFKDTRLSRDEWAAAKADRNRFPFNQMPVLRVDDTCIAESGAILQYLASEFGFHGDDNFGRARVNMICSHFQGLGNLMIGFIFEQDKEVAAQKRTKFFDEQLPQALSCFEEILSQRENGNKYFLGDKMTLADLVFLDASLYVAAAKPTAYDDFPKMKALKARLEGHPTIAEYIPTRKR